MDYGFVGVRELGSAYEGLLEFSLKIAAENLVAVKQKGKEVYVKAGAQGRKKVVGQVNKGQPYLVNDKKERRPDSDAMIWRVKVGILREITKRRVGLLTFGGVRRQGEAGDVLHMIFAAVAGMATVSILHRESGVTLSGRTGLR